MIDKTKLYIIYEYTMVILALIVVSMLIGEIIFDLPETTALFIEKIDTFILAIFIADYSIKLFMAENKKRYVLSNKAELISIIPFSSIFRVFRLARLVRLARLSRFNRVLRSVAWLTRFKDKFLIFIKTNGLIYIIFITIVIVVLGSVCIKFFEDINFLDAIWWAFVTTTTVGYGDISPVSFGGRIVAGTLMLVGIGFIGMLTGTIATFFLNEGKKPISYEKEVITDIKNKLDKFDELTSSDLEQMFVVLRGLKGIDR
ncbi:potassium channel family protein [Alkalicella caledoniensis]|uniref:Potassium channel family protein n=1 Tax=Alkalicella caledoniensis TaxID=2731377 RepID=A0A7G9W898_ALKCA|nr:potassium channel family protein [Alkalicella caledoniensis]QNO14910.1 potassium channel family protein [Alkalicella caledoniensis]